MVYVAYKLAKGEVRPGCRRRASQNMNELREMIRAEGPGTWWAVASYGAEERWTVARIAQMVDDSTEVEADAIVGLFEIKADGRVQMKRGSSGEAEGTEREPAPRRPRGRSKRGGARA